MGYTDLEFEGGNIFDHGKYTERVMVESMAMTKAMGNNVDLTYARVNVEGATRDLAAKGYTLRQATHVDTMTNINTSLIDDQLAGMMRDYFEEDIRMSRGDDVFFVIISDAIKNQVTETNNGFFSSSERSEGHYYSYQLTFYSLRKASYCFVVFSVCAFKEAESVFGIPTKFRTGIAYSLQAFEVEKTDTTVLYNHGRLKEGRAVVSPNGQHRATLGSDGNFKVDSRWSTDTAGKGKAPRHIRMQEDANLVLYDADDQVPWAAGSQPGRWAVEPFRLEVLDNGQLVIYDDEDTRQWSV